MPASELRQSWLAWRGSITSPIYRIYERHLLRQVRAVPVPRHIGLILDGNRRYARHHNLSDPHDIYTAGGNKLDELLDWCSELKIQSMTLWVCSTENLKRPSDQVAGILSAVERKLEQLGRGQQIQRLGIRVRAVGRIELLLASTITILRATEAATKYHSGMCLTIAAAYGGREEIVDAIQRLLQEQFSQGKSLADVIELLTPGAIGQSLYAPDLPDF